MKKILLIEPRSANYHVYSAFPLPRLGLPLLGAMLRDRGYDVDIYIQECDNVPLSAVEEADLVGVSSTTSTSPEAYKIARLAKDYGKPVVMGGSHVTFMAEEALRYCDVVVRGEGELSFPPLIEAIAGGADPDELGAIRGISFMRDGGVVNTPDQDFVMDLDSLPFPDLSLIRWKRRMPLIPIQTSRGCPYDCSFCSVTQLFGHKYRFRSPANVVEELKMYPGRRVFFCDDHFCAVPGHTKELLTMIRDRRVPIQHWSAQTRVNVARDPELLALMRETGCVRVYIGFESVNPKTLEIYNKKQNVEDIEECIRILHRNHIKVHGMFVLGSDEDDVTTARDTLRFADRMRIDTIQFLALTPLPGTRTTRELEDSRRIFTHDWRLFDGHHVVFNPNRMSPYQLQKTIFRAMGGFYSIPRAMKSFVRMDMINFGLGFIGHHLVRKARGYSRDFVEGLRHHEFRLANWAPSPGFLFDDNRVVSRVIQFKRKIKDRMEDLRLKITIKDEFRSRASFIDLSGDLDYKRAKAVRRMIRQSIKKGKMQLVISFENVRHATPKAIEYLAQKVSRLQKRHRSVSILGMDPGSRRLMLSAADGIPNFEFFDSPEALRNYMRI
mgnify:CR=1 FL=1